MIRIRQSENVHDYRILLPIKPCPFCLSDDSLLELWGIGDNYQVRCPVCWAHGPSKQCPTEAVAVYMWNTRG